MKHLHEFIVESASNLKVNLKAATNSRALTELKKYSYDNLDKSDRKNSVWELGFLSETANGIVVEFPKTKSDCELYIRDVKKLNVPFNICKLSGNGIVDIIETGLTSLEKVFTADCKGAKKVDLYLWGNKDLVSLKNCPDFVNHFTSEYNRKLDDWEGAPKNCHEFTYYDSYKGISYNSPSIGWGESSYNDKMVRRRQRLQAFDEWKEHIDRWTI